MERPDNVKELSSLCSLGEARKWIWPMFLSVVLFVLYFAA